MSYQVNDSLGYIVNVLARRMRSILHLHFKKIGVDITAEQWGMLAILSENDCQNQMELAEKHFKEKSNIARIVDGMEKRGLLIRQQSNVDRRKNLVCLTASGKELYTSLLPVLENAKSDALQGISQTDEQQIKQLLWQICENLNRVTEISAEKQIQ